MNPDKPLPKWRSLLLLGRSKWRRGKGARSIAYANLKIVGAKLLTLAVSVVGAMLISFGVWQIYAPAGYIVGGILAFGLQWSHEKDKERR